MRGRRGPKAGKIAIAWQEIRQRITGISTPMLGLQWSAPEPERKVVRDLLIFFADRRVLFNDFMLEVEGEVIHSLNDIRHELTGALQRLADDAPAVPAINQMRGACRRFLDRRWPDVRVCRPMPHDEDMGPNFFLALGELRATFGRAIAELSALYEIDVAPELETILPEPG
jgi:hypothetical protein